MVEQSKCKRIHESIDASKLEHKKMYLHAMFVGLLNVKAFHQGALSLAGSTLILPINLQLIIDLAFPGKEGQ